MGSRLSRTSLALVAALAGLAVLASVAMAARIVGTDNGETLNGTPFRDFVNA